MRSDLHVSNPAFPGARENRVPKGAIKCQKVPESAISASLVGPSAWFYPLASGSQTAIIDNDKNISRALRVWGSYMRDGKNIPFRMWLILGVIFIRLGGLHAAPWINEILLNPPGSPDTPQEYVEIRGQPNGVLPSGTYLVAVEGGTNSNPGTIQNLFDLSGKTIGGNGFLVLLQRSNSYAVPFGATRLQNEDSGPGWGSGATSSIGHTGEDGQTELENGSVTFFLVQTTNRPVVGNDIDADDNGLPDGSAYAGWSIHDSIGLIGNAGGGGFAYGAVNFRNTPAGIVLTGAVLDVGFEVDYLGRNGNSTGTNLSDWVVGGKLAGTAPLWQLGSAGNTQPASAAGKPLGQPGAPNFGAPPLPGILLNSPGLLEVAEAGGITNYFLSLNAPPLGSVAIRVEADAQLLVSTQPTGPFASGVTLFFTGTNAQPVYLQARDDNWVEARVQKTALTHLVESTSDPAGYPLDSLIPNLRVNVLDNDLLLLNEVRINPPGADEGAEYLELSGAPGAMLTNVLVVGLEGDVERNPGKVGFVLPLSGVTLDAHGLLLITGTNALPGLPGGIATYATPLLDRKDGLLYNRSFSLLLLTTTGNIDEGEDLDNGDNGVLEGLPNSAVTLDSLAWWDGDTNDVLYGNAVLYHPQWIADAAFRLWSQGVPSQWDAWACGDLSGQDPQSLVFNDALVSSNFPPLQALSPGSLNYPVPAIESLSAISGVIGDPLNPSLDLVIGFPPGSTNTAVWVASLNTNVIASEGLMMTQVSPTLYRLQMEPHGVGYASLVVAASDGRMTSQRTVAYAASLMGRPGGLWLTGASDASAAIPIDGDWMFVGDDENQTLRIYSRRRSGGVAAHTNMTPFLGLTDIENNVPREVDIEGATRVGDRLFWIGAHSHANIAEVRTNRSRIFATDVTRWDGTNSTLRYVGRYDFLKFDLCNWDATNGHGKGANYYGFMDSTADGVDPKSPLGFNIEGLAMAPGSTNIAYIGLRAPIGPPTNRVHALVLPVLNFAELAGSDGLPGSARFGLPIELDLLGRGIRSLEGDGGTNFLIVAGTSLVVAGPYPDDFKLYTWTGRAEDPPVERSTDLWGLTPESSLELPPTPWASNSTVQLLSDWGARIPYGDGLQNKFNPERGFRKFRCDTVTLGVPVKSQPILRQARAAGGSVQLTWRGRRGDVYQLQACPALGSLSPWQNIGAPVAAVAEFTTVLDSQPGATNRFYRLQVLP